jgi:O-antigen ligase
MRAPFARVTGQITGLSRGFFYAQTAALVLVSVWSLGGRAEGAIPVIGLLAWSSLLYVFFDPSFRTAILEMLCLRDRFSYGLSWLALILVLLLVPFNSEFVVATNERGGVVLVVQQYLAFLPTTLVEARCHEYGLLLSGLLVQTMVAWHALKSQQMIRHLLTCLAGHAIVLALVGAAFRLSGSERILGLAEPVHPGFFASFRYHNHWTAFALLAMGLCLALSVYWYRRGRHDEDVRRRRPDLFWLAGLLLLSLTLPMTTARAGVLFLFVFWFALGARLIWSYWREKAMGGGKSRKGLVLVAPLAVITLLVYGVWSSSGDLEKEWQQSLQQIEQLKAGQYELIDSARTDSWGDSWRMLRDRPIWGHGFGSHRYLYQIYARDEYRFESGVVEHIKEFAHNDWMQYLAELGVAGFGLLLLPPLALMRRYWRGLRRSVTSQALGFSLLLVLLLATFEFPLSNPAVLVMAFLQGVLCLKYAQLAQGDPEPNP